MVLKRAWVAAVEKPVNVRSESFGKKKHSFMWLGEVEQVFWNQGFNKYFIMWNRFLFKDWSKCLLAFYPPNIYLLSRKPELPNLNFWTYQWGQKVHFVQHGLLRIATSLYIAFLRAKSTAYLPLSFLFSPGNLFLSQLLRARTLADSSLWISPFL